MVGIPPAAGFFSQWYLLLGGIDAGNWFFVAVILASRLLTAGCFFRVLEQVYATHTHEESAPVHAADPPLSMLLPTLLLGAGLLILGLFNSAIVTYILNSVAQPLQRPGS
jgi:multicomponent Na+:H+ antiporter subunit D